MHKAIGVMKNYSLSSENTGGIDGKANLFTLLWREHALPKFKTDWAAIDEYSCEQNS